MRSILSSSHRLGSVAASKTPIVEAKHIVEAN